MKLLSVNSDPKTIKGNKYGYSTAILYLAPYNISGNQVCPVAEKAKCHETCLYYAGHGRFNSVQESRIKKTRFYFDKPKEFIDQLFKEIGLHVKKSKKNNTIPCIRLNGTSDIPWGKTGVFDKFPDVQFYDYYKNPVVGKQHHNNYHLTYSYSPVYPKYPDNHNWAVVFNCDLPREYLGRKVINGDEHDLRFLDEQNVVVGLKAKGSARKDKSGFVVNGG